MKFSNLMNNLKLDTPSKFKVGQNLRLEIHVQKAIPFLILDEFQQMRAQNFQGGELPNVGYTGMCHRPGSIFHFQKPRTSPKFWSFTPEQAPLFGVLL